jgi:hypothetical protein
MTSTHSSTQTELQKVRAERKVLEKEYETINKKLKARRKQLPSLWSRCGCGPKPSPASERAVRDRLDSLERTRSYLLLKRRKLVELELLLQAHRFVHR